MTAPIGPRPGQPGHLADHEAIEAGIMALDGTRYQALYYPPELIPLRAGWFGGYQSPGAHTFPMVARVGQSVFLSGMISSDHAAAAGERAGDLPQWAWPDFGVQILSPQTVRFEVNAAGEIYIASTLVANGWYSLSFSYTILRTDEGVG